MASPVVDFILKARNEASNEINKIAHEVTGLTGVVQRLGSAAGTFGLLAAGAVTTGAAVVGLARKYTEFAEHLRVVGGATGSTSDQVQVMEGAFRRMGLGAELADKAMLFLTRSMGNNKKALRDFHIDSRNAAVVMEELATKMQGIKDPGERMRIAFDLLGRAGRQTAGAFPLLVEGLNATRNAYKQSGGLLTEEAATKAQILDDRMDDLRTRFEGTAIVLAQQLTPVAETIVGLLEAMALKGNDAADSGNKFARAWGPIAVVVGDMVGQLTAFIKILWDLIATLANVAAHLAVPGLVNPSKIFGPKGDLATGFNELNKLANERAEQLVHEQKLLDQLAHPAPGGPALMSAHGGVAAPARRQFATHEGFGAGEFGQVGDENSREKAIQGIIDILNLEGKTGRDVATSMHDRLQELKQDMQSLAAVGELRLLGPEFSAQASMALDKLDEAKMKQAALDLNRDIRLIGPNAPANLRQLNDQLDIARVRKEAVSAARDIRLMSPDAPKELRDANDALAVALKQKEAAGLQQQIDLLGPNAPKELRAALADLDLLTMRLELLKKQRGVDLIGPRAPAEARALADELERVTIREDTLKKAVELERALHLTAIQAGLVAEAMRARGEQDANVDRMRAVAPEMVKSAEAARELVEALTGSSEAGRAFMLQMLGLADVAEGFSDLEKHVARFGKAMETLQKRAARSSALQGLSGALGTGDLSKEDEGILSNLLRQDDLAAFTRRLQEVTSSYGVFRSAMANITQSIQSGIEGVFMNMVGTTQTLGRALLSVWQVILKAILAEIGKFLAARIIILFLKLVKIATGNTDPSDVLGVVTLQSGQGGITPSGMRQVNSSLARSRPATTPGGFAAGGSGNTFIINAIDAHDVVASIIAPSGGMRRGLDRVRIAGAY